MAPISVQNDILPHLEREVDTLKKEHSSEYMATGLNSMIDRFRRRHHQRVFKDKSALLLWYAGEVSSEDKFFDPPPTLLNEIKGVWRRILQTLSGERTGDDAGSTGRRGSNGARGTQEETVIVQREDANITRRKLNQYLDLALAMGAEEAIQVLIAAGEISPSYRKQSLEIVKDFLGACHTERSVEMGTFLRYPPSILEIPSVHLVLKTLCRDHIYQELIATCIDELDSEGDLEEELAAHHERILEMPAVAVEIMQNICEKEGVTMCPALSTIIQELEKDFTRYALLELPKMITHITRRGKVYPVPSLGQRIVICEGTEKNIYIARKPDSGKTFASQAIAERINAVREAAGEQAGASLYIGPPPAARDLANRVDTTVTSRNRHAGYYTEDAPTVGRILSGIKSEEMEEQLSKQRIFVSYYMLHQGKDDQDVVDHIIASAQKNPISSLVIDEAHNLNGDRSFAHSIKRLMAGIPGLYEQGRIVAMSATPITKDLDGLQKILTDLREKPTITESIGGPTRVFDADQLRTESRKHMYVLDKQDFWQQSIRRVEFQLSPSERRFQQMIIEDNTRGIKEKINLLMLFVLNPRLVSGNPHMPWSLLESLKGQVEEYLQTANSILITENELRRGVTDEFDATDDSSNETFPPLYKAIEAYLEELQKKNNDGVPIRFNVIHGDTKLKQREQYFRMAAESQESGLTKTVTLVMRGCVAEGIDLSCYDRQIGLQHPWAVPFYEQLIKRSMRENNEGFEAAVLIGRDTIFEAQYWHAEYKFEPIERFLHGYSLNEMHMGNIAREEDDTSAYKAKKRIQLGTPVVQMLSTEERNAEKAKEWMQNGGLGREYKYWSGLKHEQEYYKLFVREQSGLTVPQHEVAGAALLRDLHKKKILQGKNVLNLKSHALAQERILKDIEGKDYDWNMSNITPYLSLESAGRRLMDKEGTRVAENPCHQGMMNDSAKIWNDGTTFDAVICTDGLQNTRPPRLSIDEMEAGGASALRRSQRVQTILNNIKVVRDDGLLIYGVPYESCTTAEWAEMEKALVAFGMDIVASHTGTMESSDNEAGDTHRIRFITAKKIPMPNGDREERIAKASEELSATTFQMTHVQSWPERKRTQWEKERNKRKLPYAMLRHRYKLNSSKMYIPYRPEERLKHADHLERISSAVSILRQMHADGSDLARLSLEEQNTLRELGVMYSPVMSKKRPAFSFKDQGIAQILYPLDSVWEE